ncbi:hypothetical protein [Microbacterium sp. GXF6406]
MRSRTHEMRVPSGIPAAVLRALTALIGIAGVIVLNGYPVWQMIGALAFTVGAVLPRSLATWAGAAVIVLGMALGEPSPWRTALALLILHLVHVLGSVCMVVPLTSRMQPQALQPTFRRFVGVQLIAQPVAVLVVVMPAVGDGGVSWLAPIGGVIVAGVAVLLPRARTRS